MHGLQNAYLLVHTGLLAAPAHVPLGPGSVKAAVSCICVTRKLPWHEPRRDNMLALLTVIAGAEEATNTPTRSWMPKDLHADIT